MIADLQKEIERVKARAAAKEAKRDPALRHITAAVRSIDKASAESKDNAIRKSLGEARATLSACLALSGVATNGRAVSAKPVDPEAVVAYVAEHPGSSGEDIAQAMDTDTKTLRPAIKKLIEEDRVKTKGQRRGMRYTAV